MKYPRFKFAYAWYIYAQIGDVQIGENPLATWDSHSVIIHGLEVGSRKSLNTETYKNTFENHGRPISWPHLLKGSESICLRGTGYNYQIVSYTGRVGRKGAFENFEREMGTPERLLNHATYPYISQFAVNQDPVFVSGWSWVAFWSIDHMGIFTKKWQGDPNSWRVFVRENPIFLMDYLRARFRKPP